MNCPNCGYEDCGVVDSRPTEEGSAVRRRRECDDCGTRFTTYERPEWDKIQVRKRNGSMEPFDRDKLLDGIRRAVEKRPVSEEEAEEITDEIHDELSGMDRKVVDSDRIGDLVSERLREIDEVAYLRFVSVYKEFSDPDQFARELDKMEE
ncbi:MAG: transcriptional regulator NrdR [Halobacteria archaeon]|nr:transcriptional regulator NrdR [Halobacteria archaeon]